MQVRDFHSDDREACLRVFDSNVPDFFLPPEREGFIEFLDDLPGPYLIVLDEDGQLIACGGYAINPEHRRADLCWGMVENARHRLGIGTVLLDERIQRAKADAQIDSVRLDTGQHTTAFYQRHGFSLVSTEVDGYGPNLHRCEMRYQIRPAIRQAV